MHVVSSCIKICHQNLIQLVMNTKKTISLTARNLSNVAKVNQPPVVKIAISISRVLCIIHVMYTGFIQGRHKQECIKNTKHKIQFIEKSAQCKLMLQYHFCVLLEQVLLLYYIIISFSAVNNFLYRLPQGNFQVHCEW